MEQSDRVHDKAADTRPRVSVVAPAYNEAAILQDNLAALLEYLEVHRDEYEWQVIVVNDGSTDDTGVIAEEFARSRDDVEVIHHNTNLGLGHALRTAFARCEGDYVVTIDVDLSYSPDHIGSLLQSIRETGAQMVLASPYLPGDAAVTSVPWLRRVMSSWANKLLSRLAHGRLATLTCMVRAYDGQFLKCLALRSSGMEIMPEMIYKTMILRGQLVEIPAHLDWSGQVSVGAARPSSMRIVAHMISTLVSGLFFRPFMFFVVPGLVVLAFSIYVNAWMVIHFIDSYVDLGGSYPGFAQHTAAAVAAAYELAPHTFVIGFMSLMLAIQLISLGLMSFQNKRYFEETFFQGAMTHRMMESRSANRTQDS